MKGVDTVQESVNNARVAFRLAKNFYSHAQANNTQTHTHYSSLCPLFIYPRDNVCLLLSWWHEETLISHWTNQHADASAMPGSATVNCAWLWNKQHLFLLISSLLSVSKFVSVAVCLHLILSLSLTLWQTSSLSFFFLFHRALHELEKKSTFSLFITVSSFIDLIGCLNLLSLLSLGLPTHLVCLLITAFHKF